MIKKTLFVTLLFLASVGINLAQNPAVDSLVKSGIKLYDKENYKDALEEYKKALALDKNSPDANYEIASTYYALADYEKAIEHCDVVISLKTDLTKGAYITKGSALDLLKKPEEAIKTYKKAIKEFPKDHLLRYNLALTLYNQSNDKEAEAAVKEALVLKPSHASSHLLLSYLTTAQEARVKTLLCLYNFLLMESNTSRSKTVYQQLNQLLKKGVSKNGNSTTITMSEKGTESDEFEAADLMVSLLEASKSLESNEGKTENGLFVANTQKFFGILGELKKNNKGFWWNYYVDFFSDMNKAGHVEAFCYFISKSKSDESIGNWLKNNKDKVEALSNWYKGYQRWR